MTKIFPSIEERKQFSIAEVAKAFEVSVQAVHQWLRIGRIRRTTRTSRKGRYRIPRSEFIRLLRRARRSVQGVWPASPSPLQSWEKFGRDFLREFGVAEDVNEQTGELVRRARELIRRSS